MKQDEILPLPDERNIIHNFVIRKHETGLSPPEERLLMEVEGREASLQIFVEMLDALGYELVVRSKEDKDAAEYIVTDGLDTNE